MRNDGFITGPGIAQTDEDVLSFEARRAAEEEEQRKAGVRVARRLVVAFILIALVAVVSWVVLPRFGMVLPPMLPVLAFLTILIATLITNAPPKRESAPDDADTCGPSCGCSGPRPVGELSRRMKTQKRH